jgi:putative FmdB family regulatory protein
MPVYEYKCPDHGHYETFMPMDKCNEGTCPTCGKSGRRLFSDCHVYMDCTAGFDHSLNTYVATPEQRHRICEERGLKRYKD